MKRWLSILLILLMTYLSTSVLAMADDSEQHRISCLKIEDNEVGHFNFETKAVLLNSGYQMPILGLGTYALNYDVCVNSVKALLANGGRLIDTAYMYGNEDAVGEGVRQAMAEYGIPREEIFVITKIYPSQFSDPEAAIEMALEKLDIERTARVKTLSKGTREKIQLILVMSRRAKLYILDEPIAGVDPAARDYIIRTIINNYDPEAAVLICTHLISDIENILDDVIFLKYGKIVLKAGADEIRQKVGKTIDQYFREVFAC